MAVEYIPKVSVVIPVWNPGPGIVRCIESLRTQTLRDIELIFVDDCDPSDAMSPVRSAATEDPRIRIIENEENLGEGASRNRGIEAARGFYIASADPDDYMALDFLERLYSKAEAEGFPDIVKGSSLTVDESGILTNYQYENEMSRRIEEGLSRGEPLAALFNARHFSALYLREFLMQHTVRYGSSRVACDTTFLLCACTAAKSFVMIDADYYYVMREGAATSIYTPARLRECGKALDEMVDFSIEHGLTHPAFIRYYRRKLTNWANIGRKAVNTGSDATLVAEQLDALAEKAKRLPFADELGSESLMLRILLDFGADDLLRLYPMLGTTSKASDHADAISAWIDIAQANPVLAKKNEFTDAFYHTFKNCVRNLTVEGFAEGSTDERKAALDEIRADLKRVPFLRKLSVRDLRITIFAAGGPNLFTLRERARKSFR